MNPTKNARVGLAGVALFTTAWLAPRPYSAPAPAFSGGPTPISNLPMVITEPGAYCVTQNLVGVPGEHGISIQAQDVVLDLGGFELRGAPGDASKIGVLSGQGKVLIKNGSVVGWGERGVAVSWMNTVSQITSSRNAGGGISATGGCVVEDCRTWQNDEFGIRVDSGCRVESCAVLPPPDSVGVIAGSGSLVKDVQVEGAGTAFVGRSGASFENCSAVNIRERGFVGETDNVGFRDCGVDTLGSDALVGFQVPVNGRIRDCWVDGGADTGIAIGVEAAQHVHLENVQVRNCKARGILAGDGSRVLNCTVSDTGLVGSGAGTGIYALRDVSLTGSISRQNEGNGMVTGSGASLSNCEATHNGRDGFSIQETTSLADCRSTWNQGRGIWARGGANRIRRNLVQHNDEGIVASGVTNLIEENDSVKNPGGDFDVPWGNALGPVENPEAAIMNLDPHSNFGRR